MFTGIVEEVGRVAEARPDGGGVELLVGCRAVLADAAVGASIAVDGCCLTMTSVARDGFGARVSSETLRVTTLGGRRAGDRVNLERPLAATGRLGGHVVQGHVDGVGQVVERDDEPGGVIVTIKAPPAVSPYLVPKGSVAVDGVSLTVVDTDAHDSFRVALIPHTLEGTTLGNLCTGRQVNVEADILAKYVERLVGSRRWSGG